MAFLKGEIVSKVLSCVGKYIKLGGGSNKVKIKFFSNYQLTYRQ